MDFAWSDVQVQLYEAAQTFAAKHLVEGVIERDRASEFSRDLWDQCAKFGLQGLVAAPEWGGSGRSMLDAVAVLEGIGRGCRDNGLVFSVAAHLSSCVGVLSTFGEQEVLQRYLPSLVDGSSIGATAITEPDSGTHIYDLKTTAEKVGDEFVLNGSKTFVTNAPVADVFLVYARTGDPGPFGMTCFVVPRDSVGLEVGREIEKSGLRTSPMAELFLSECKVPETHVVGSVGAGAMVFAESIELERLLVLAPAVGAMERLLERCVEHAKNRRTQGRPIGKFQAVSHRLADMKSALESSRFMLYRAAWTKMNRKHALRESALAKLAVSEAYVACSRAAVQVFGGYGYTVEYELERELRDATASTIYVGTSEVQRGIIASTLGV